MMNSEHTPGPWTTAMGFVPSPNGAGSIGDEVIQKAKAAITKATGGEMEMPSEKSVEGPGMQLGWVAPAEDWKIAAYISANSQENLRLAIRKWFAEIEGIELFEDLWKANGGHNDSGGNTYGYYTNLSGPVDAKIKALREEADRLEKEKKST